MSFVESGLDTAGCSLQARSQIRTAVDEIFGNICFYAYSPGPGPVTVRMDSEKETQTFVLSFRDAGTPYNPLEANRPDIELPGEDRPIGGLGIFLVREMMDYVDYEYKDGQNILTLKKKL